MAFMNVFLTMRLCPSICFSEPWKRNAKTSSCWQCTQQRKLFFQVDDEVSGAVNAELDEARVDDNAVQLWDSALVAAAVWHGCSSPGA